MNRKLMPSPHDIDVMRLFLNDCCPAIHVDALRFTRPASGAALIIHYRDERDHSHKKMIQNPNARTRSDLEDMVVIASEWLSHVATRQADALESATVH